MFPSVFGIQYIHTYGLFVGIAIVSSIYVATKLGVQSGLKEKDLNRLFIAGVLAGLIGGRFFYALEDLQHFIEHPLEFFLINQGGLTVYGALIIGVATWIFLIKRHRMPLMKTLDALVVSLPLGLAIGRMGCFSAGCCYGKTIVGDHVPWYAIKFPADVNSFAPVGQFLYPTQLMDLTYNLFIFIVLIVFRKKFQKYDGQSVWLFMILYGIFRSIVEVFRGDMERGFIINNYLSVSQAISIPIVIFASYMLIFYKGKAFILPDNKS